MTYWGGINTFSDINCFRCRTLMIQNALCFPDLGACFIYLERVHKTSRKLSRLLWSRETPQKPSKFRHIFELHPRYFLTKLKKSLPPALKYFSDVLRCSNCHQSIPLNVRNIKHDYNMCWKCIHRDIEAKNWAKQFFEKAFFEMHTVRGK